MRTARQPRSRDVETSTRKLGPEPDSLFLTETDHRAVASVIHSSADPEPPGGRLIVEHPGRLSDRAREALLHQLDEGARLRWQDRDGRIWPADTEVVTLPRWALLLGGFIGAAAAIAAGLVS